MMSIVSIIRNMFVKKGKVVSNRKRRIPLALHQLPPCIAYENSRSVRHINDTVSTFRARRLCLNVYHAMRLLNQLAIPCTLRRAHEMMKKMRMRMRCEEDLKKLDRALKALVSLFGEILRTSVFLEVKPSLSSEHHRSCNIEKSPALIRTESTFLAESALPRPYQQSDVHLGIVIWPLFVLRSDVN
jgi:hypothetical protein